MRAEKLVKETKLTIGISLFISLALFITWFILETTSISFPNSKAF